jgi:hypothetical protein
MNKYWQNSITFDEYIKETERRIAVQNQKTTITNIMNSGFKE